MNNVFSVKEGDNLMFMTDSGNIITLYNLTYTITSPGAGAIGLSGSECEGISLSYPIPGDFHKIINQGIKKVRFYTSKGYIEEDVKPKKAKIFIESYRLILGK